MSCLYCAIALKKEVENVAVRRTKLTYIFGSHRSGEFYCPPFSPFILLSFYKLVYNFAEAVLRYFGLQVDSGEL